MIYKYIYAPNNGAKWDVLYSESLQSLTVSMEAMGFPVQPPSYKPWLREEMQDAPTFKGVIGPMWDGMVDGEGVIRYECPVVNEALSR